MAVIMEAATVWPNSRSPPLVLSWWNQPTVDTFTSVIDPLFYGVGARPTVISGTRNESH